MKYFVLFLTILCYSSIHSQTTILFDASKAQMCGNADWIIDADNHTIGTSSNGSMVVGSGNESNPQRYPTPSYTQITSNTPETFWDGALSAWAIDLVKLGYRVETLPVSGQITYGNANNPQDLSNYKVFISVEPNIRFSLSEKQAIIKFVENGGGLFMIADHTISDRNFDGWDSPMIWNSLADTNGLQNNPFGIHFDYQNYSETTTALANLPTDSCLHNSAVGNVSQLKISGGTTMTVNPSVNSTVRGLIYRSGSNTTGNTNIYLARSNYVNGRVAALGDSSPPDDGTGDLNDNLYFSYTGEANGSHRIMLLNTTIWLLSGHQGGNQTSVEENKEASSKLMVQQENGFGFRVFGIMGKVGYRLISINGQVKWEGKLGNGDFMETGNMVRGMYVLIGEDGSWLKVVIP
jgi:hypothetical protein